LIGIQDVGDLIHAVARGGLQKEVSRTEVPAASYFKKILRYLYTRTWLSLGRSVGKDEGNVASNHEMK
jgi:hypothetical protein